MDLDVERLLGAVERTVSPLERDGQAARAVTLARSYATTVQDLWDAVTSAERIPRWFLPVSGQLELGGHYQLEGNAGGTISHCERPSHLGLTWEFGSDVSWVEARLCNDGIGRSRLAITHIALVSDHWHTFGPGAVGVGWEMGLLGWSCILRSRTNPGWTQQRSTRHVTERRSLSEAARLGAGRPWQRERIPTLRTQRRSVRRPFTPARRPHWIEVTLRPLSYEREVESVANRTINDPRHRRYAVQTLDRLLKRLSQALAPQAPPLKAAGRMAARSHPSHLLLLNRFRLATPLRILTTWRENITGEPEHGSDHGIAVEFSARW